MGVDDADDGGGSLVERLMIVVASGDGRRREPTSNGHCFAGNYGGFAPIGNPFGMQNARKSALSRIYTGWVYDSGGVLCVNVCEELYALYVGILFLSVPCCCLCVCCV